MGLPLQITFDCVDAGGAEIRRVEEDGGWWVVMHDPEGNEFCVT